MVPNSININFLNRLDFRSNITKIIAVVLSLFHLYTSFSGSLPALQQRSFHLGLALVLIFLIDKGKKQKNIVMLFIDIFLALIAFINMLYVMANWYDLTLRIAIPTQVDKFIGVVTILLLLEAVRRVLGWPMLSIVIMFILYGMFGHYLPGDFGHKAYSLDRIISHLFMSTEGIYGFVLGISATYIALFVIFGAFLETSGTGQFFINLASGLFGTFRGGPAKIAVISSGLMGMISGSAVANVVTTGSVSIPMMKKIGYESRFAGAVEAVASTGGQFLPPIMGATAFLIAETLNVPYIELIKAAFIPGVLYFLAVIIMVDLQAAKTGMKGLPRDELPDVRVLLYNYFQLLIPPILLIMFLAVFFWSPIRAGAWSIVALLIVSLRKRETRMSISKLVAGLEKAAHGVLEVAVACAAAGIIIGMVSLTGVGLKFSSLLITLSHGSLPFLLFLTMISALILGMGLTTTPVYIILSVLVAPALVDKGIPLVAAHLFVFYFGILSAITPPVGIATYAAAGIAKADPIRLGVSAWKLGLAGYILPFIFVFNPSLLMEGTALNILRALFTAIVGISALAGSVEGYLFSRIRWPIRVLLLIGAVMLIDPKMSSDLIGLPFVIAVGIANWFGARKAAITVVKVSHNR